MTRTPTRALPAPLVPSECDLRDFKFMPVEIERLRKSKSWMRARRIPFLALHLFNMWMRAFHELPSGSIDNDEDTLCSAADCSPEQWQAQRAEIMRGWVLCSDNRWHHPVVAEKVLDGWAGRLRARYRSKSENRRKAIYRAKQDGEPIPPPFEPFDRWLKENYPESYAIFTTLFPDEKTTVSAENADLSHGTGADVPRHVRPKTLLSRKGEGDSIGDKPPMSHGTESAPSGSQPDLAAPALGAHKMDQGSFDIWAKTCRRTIPKGWAPDQAAKRWARLPPHSPETWARAWDLYIAHVSRQSEGQRHRQRVRYPESWLKDRTYQDFLDEALQQAKAEADRAAHRVATIARWGPHAQAVIDRIGLTMFDSWLLDSALTVIQPARAILEVPKPFVAKWLAEHPEIVRAIETVTNAKVEITQPARKIA